MPGIMNTLPPRPGSGGGEEEDDDVMEIFEDEIDEAIIVEENAPGISWTDSFVWWKVKLVHLVKGHNYW